MRVIDLGTGVNSQIITTSIYWRMDVYTGIILLLLGIPLNYILTKELGIIGTAISNLIAITMYNFARFLFLWKKFKMQPFTLKSIYTLLLAVTCYLICHSLFDQHMGLNWIIIRSSVFMVLYLGGAFALTLSPDIKPVLENIHQRLTRTRK